MVNKMLAKYNKKHVSMILVIVMCVVSIVIPSQTAFAANSEIIIGNEKVELKSIGDNSVLIKSENGIGTIEIIKDNAEYREVLVNSKEDGNIKFIYDKNKGSVYSTKTGNQIKVSNDNLTLNSSVPNKVKVGDKKTKYISYYEIKRAVGATGTIASIAGFIVSFFPGASAALVGVIITRLGGITGLISLVSKGSKDHGIKITSVYFIRRVTKNGKVYKFGDWKLQSITTY